MPLANIVGITNTGRTFSLTFSFIRSESAENFDFIFQSLDELVFYNIPCPRIVLSDQAKGFIKSLSAHWTSDHTTHQLCEWHMVQNIKKRLVEGAYNKQQQDHIQHLLWKYIHCLTIEGVAEAKRNLYFELHAEECNYMKENWEGKEVQVLRCYTQHYPNLGAYSTQRNEGHHVAVKQFLNPQITLGQATSRLMEHLQHAVNRVESEEAESRTKVPRFLDTGVFKSLIGHITLYAINMVKVEWEEAKKIVGNELEECSCTIINQFGLPCRHRLAFICLANSPSPLPISIDLLHPRWRINDIESIPPLSWIMPSNSSITHNSDKAVIDPVLLLPPQVIQHDCYVSNGQDLLLRSLHDLELLQGELVSHNAEVAELMVQRVNTFTTALRDEFTSMILQPIPRDFAPAGPSSSLPQRKAKGKAKARTLTSGEMAERKRRCLRTKGNKDTRIDETEVTVPVGQVDVGIQNETQDCIHIIPSTAPARC